MDDFDLENWNKMVSSCSFIDQKKKKRNSSYDILKLLFSMILLYRLIGIYFAKGKINMKNMFKLEQLWQMDQVNHMKRGLINKCHVCVCVDVDIVGDKIQTFCM